MSRETRREVPIVGARVHAGAGRPTAQALPTRDGRVAALGTEAEVRPLASPGAREVLAAYTAGPARAAGLADRRGRLLPGDDADLVARDRDPLRCEPEEYREMRCLLTMVAGEVVHRAGG